MSGAFKDWYTSGGDDTVPVGMDPYAFWLDLQLEHADELREQDLVDKEEL